MSEAAIDPSRHFAAVNYCAAKCLLNHLVGNGEDALAHTAEQKLLRLM